MQHDAQHGQAQRDFVADHVGGGAEAAEERVLVVARPAADDHAVHRQRQHGEDEQHADVEVGDLERLAVGDV